MNAHYELQQANEEYEGLCMALDQITSVKRWQQVERRAVHLEREMKRLEVAIETGEDIYCQECGDEYDVTDTGDQDMCKDCRAEAGMY